MQFSMVTCNQHDQQNNEKDARQFNNTSQSPGTTKNKIKAVLALINEFATSRFN
jgi:hypothetical protein